jgi:enterochelin esterase family protein
MPQHQAVPELKYRADVPHGTFDTLQFVSKDTVLRPRRVIVYKPAGYEKFSDLPVILMHDGEDALNYGEAENVLDNLVAEGKMVPVIGVFVPAIERGDEYDGMKTYDYTKALCGELMPMIEAKYSVSKDPLKHATVGASDGGHITLDLFFGHPETFGCAGGQSSTISAVIHELEYSAVDRHSLSPQARLYVDVGTYDIPERQNSTFYDLNKAFDAGLTAEHVPHIFRVVHQGHEWGSWRERWPEMFQYFFPKN